MAQIVLKPIDATQPALPAASESARRLRDAAIDTDTLEHTATELKLGSGAAAEAAAKQRIDAMLEVRQGAGANTFDFYVRAPTAVNAERIANLLARHAAARAVNALAPAPLDASLAREAARTKSAGDLAAFITAHPELSPATPSVVPVAGKDAPETDSAALRAERDKIEAKLARTPESTTDSDNPFGEQSAANAAAHQMRRRVVEIDQTLKARQHPDHKADAAPEIPPQVEREWKRLLQAVANPVVAEETPRPPTFTVMLREAVEPNAPIDPDRRRVAIFGALAAFAVAFGTSILQGLLRRRAPTPAVFTAKSELAAAEPARPASESPRVGSGPPVAFDTTYLVDEPPRPSSEPPAGDANSDAPQAEPTRAPSDPARPMGDPQGPIAAMATRVIGERRISSNPPARPSNAGAPVEPTAIGRKIPSPPPQSATVVSAPSASSRSSPVPPLASPIPPSGSPIPPPPSPIPAPRSPAPPRPTPGYEELRQPPAPGGLLKGTLVGMAPIDKRALESTIAADNWEAPQAAPTTARFGVGSRKGDPAGPRSTLRPPPPDTPNAPVMDTGTVSGPTPRKSTVPLGRSDAATFTEPDRDGREPEAPHQPDDSWTGPSRAHRRSMSAARRTTQMLGSPIAPVVRGSRPPPSEPRNARTQSGTPAPGDPPGRTTYSYVSTRPEAPAGRPQTNTPPYYQTPEGERQRAGTSTSQMPHAPVQPAQRTRVTKYPARVGWSPDPSLDPRARRALSDQVLPFAVEGCLVLGISAVRESRADKPQIAAELALALAEPNHPRVLLLEGDFQWPSVHRMMRVDMPMAMGFSQQLRGRNSAKADAWTVVECTPTLDVLAEGIMRSPGHILSVQFEESVRSLRSYYDVIVIDGPDASESVECRALANVIDAVAIVAPAAGSADIARAVRLFPEKSFSVVVGV
jgi:Mrp family chromosome partitioning ATPase